jgi:hypothetical protein
LADVAEARPGTLGEGAETMAGKTYIQRAAFDRFAKLCGPRPWCVYHGICRHADTPLGTSRVSSKDLGRQLGFARIDVEIHITRLVELGLINVESDGSFTVLPVDPE